MTPIAAIIIFGVSLYFLVRSSDWSVHGLSRVAAFFGLSEYVVSFVLMGFATSAPEIAVSIFAALRGDSVVAFGNNIGSNIFYPTILIGLAAILSRNLIVRPSFLKRENFYASVVALLPFVFMADFRLDRYEGFLLVAIFFWYTFKLIGSQRTAKPYNGVGDNNGHGLGEFFRHFLLLLGGIVVLVASSEGVVESALYLAKSFGLPLFVISIILIAAGVALPELAFTLRAAAAKKGDMALGNLFGSLVTNSGFALGAAAMISPIVIRDTTLFYASLIFAAGGLALFSVLAWRKSALSWRDGVLLVAVYIVFVWTMFALGERVPGT